MKSKFVTFRNLHRAVSLGLGLCLGNGVWSAPSIQSIGVSPNPLVAGQDFSIAVAASPDVASNLQAGLIRLTIDGGAGNDVLVGSPGADVLLGDEGDDVLEGGPGLDGLDGGPGDNVLIQD
jgi:Ca2+-binding RTX toxin-like protein